MRKSKMQAVNFELLGIVYDQERIIDRVRELHKPFNWEGLIFCDACDKLYPCPTIKALDGEQ